MRKVASKLMDIHPQAHLPDFHSATLRKRLRDHQPKTAAMISEARKRGATIMHVPITFSKGYNEITNHPYGILVQRVFQHALCRRAAVSVMAVRPAIFSCLMPPADEWPVGAGDR